MLGLLLNRLESERLRQVRVDLQSMREGISNGFNQAAKQFQELEQKRKDEQRKRHLLEDMTNASDVLMWRKDEDGRYIYANKRMCTSFLGLSPDCTYDVEGMTDEDLLDIFQLRTGKTHTFKDTCSLTDYVVREQKAHCRFLEFGSIGDVPILLYVNKTPIYENGEFLGTVGMALDSSSRAAEIKEKMEQKIKEGSKEVIKLQEGVYWLCGLPGECSFPIFA